MSFCSQCGKSVSEGSKFCNSCGAKIEEPFKQEEKAQGDKGNGQNLRVVDVLTDAKITRNVSVPLAFGILFVPYIFGWFVLRKGYSSTARVISISYSLLMMVILVTSMANGSGNKTETSKVTPTSVNSSQLERPAVEKSPQEKAASSSTQAWVTTERLSRYTCPSNSCGVVGTFDFRQGVSILETKNGWARISEVQNAGCVYGISEYVKHGNKRCDSNNGIESNKFSEWVVAKNLSKTRPEDPALKAAKKYELVKGSDDFKKYKNAFSKAADELIAEGYCSGKDFTEMGGWMRSTTHGNQPIYFIYCGGMTQSNKIYLNAKTGNFGR